MNEIEKATASTGATENTRRDDTKIAKMKALFRAGISLNRFEAERYGDHCLNSTVSILRADGLMLVGIWEKVPTRFGVSARVKRYRYVGNV